MTLIVNGSFLGRAQTGLQRTARSLLAAALELGLDCEVVAPAGVTDPLVDRHIGGRPGERLPHRAWEQTVLPAYARGRRVLSLTNTAPLTGRNVVWVHDLAPLVGPHWFQRSMRAYGELVLRAARRAELVLTVSEQVKRELAAAGVRAPIAVIRPAVDPSMTAPSSAVVAAAMARLGVSPPFLLFIGWPDPRKDVATAIAAHVEAARRIPHELVLVGLPRSIFAPVVLPDLPTVRNLGYVDETDLRALLGGAAALVYPSVYEGFGLPPLEARQCGTPALASDLASVREATEGRGSYLSPGDVAAWADAAARAVDGQSAPAPVDWDWPRAARHLLRTTG